MQRLSPFPEFAKLVEKNIDLVTDMHPDELRLAIEQPAAQHGVVFQQGLVEEIIKDVQAKLVRFHCSRLGIEAICQDGRRKHGESKRREFRRTTQTRTKDDDEDENDWDMTLYRYQGLPWVNQKITCLALLRALGPGKARAASRRYRAKQGASEHRGRSSPWPHVETQSKSSARTKLCSSGHGELSSFGWIKNALWECRVRISLMVG
jgi:hypothetical protein